MFTPDLVAKAVYVIDTSGAAEKFDAFRAKLKSGRPSGLNTRIFFIGCLLAASDGQGHVMTNIYDVLTEEMDADWQVRLGVRDAINGPVRFSKDAVDRMSKTLNEVTAFGEDSAAHLTTEQRAEARDALYDLIDAMLDTTLIPTDSTFRSIDATGFWAWGRSAGRRGVHGLEQDAADLEAAGKIDDAQHARAVIEKMSHELAEHPVVGTDAGVDPRNADASTLDCDGPDDAEAVTLDEQQVTSAPPQAAVDRRRAAHDPDARSSGKTAKDGKTEWFYGYSLNVTVRVAEPEQEFASEPRLIERIAVTPGGRDLVWASQELIRRAPKCEYRRTIIGDLWYSNLRTEHWYDFLRSQGWTQVVDMREDNQAWNSCRGMRVTAGQFFCPCTPDVFEKITKPVPVTQVFFERIEQRDAYAMYVHTDDVEHGKRRLMCPALVGKVRCPHRPESMALADSVPLIVDPPDLDTAPDCCRVKSTVTVYSSEPTAQGRLWQGQPWGTPKQVAQFSRRTSVEQVFAQLKDANGIDMSRGFVRVTGLGRVTLAAAFMAVASNIQELATWSAKYGDERAPAHPLLQPPGQFVVLHLNKDEAEAFAAFRRERANSKLDTRAA